MAQITSSSPRNAIGSQNNSGSCVSTIVAKIKGCRLWLAVILVVSYACYVLLLEYQTEATPLLTASALPVLHFPPNFWTTHGEFCSIPSPGCTSNSPLLDIQVAYGNPRFMSAVQEAQSNPQHKWANVTMTPAQHKFFPPGTPTVVFPMLTLDSDKDTIISKPLQEGRGFEPRVVTPLVDALNHYRQSAAQQQWSDPPILIDAGGNIGWMTANALAMGATVITFEPMRQNVGAIMSTVLHNQWQDRHYLFPNALSWEPVRVQIKSVDETINLSNGAVTDARCPTATTTAMVHNATYGVDYMDAVTLDQVLFSQYFGHVTHIAAMKLDMESYEPQALNGGMRLLCHKIVHVMVLEIQFIKQHHQTCDVNQMLRTMQALGYQLLPPGDALQQVLEGQASTKTVKSWDGVPANQISEWDLVLRLQDTSQTPYQRLSSSSGGADHACAAFAPELPHV